MPTRRDIVRLFAEYLTTMNPGQFVDHNELALYKNAVKLVPVDGSIEVKTCAIRDYYHNRIPGGMGVLMFGVRVSGELQGTTAIIDDFFAGDVESLEFVGENQDAIKAIRGVIVRFSEWLISPESLVCKTENGEILFKDAIQVQTDNAYESVMKDAKRIGENLEIIYGECSDSMHAAVAYALTEKVLNAGGLTAVKNWKE